MSERLQFAVGTRKVSGIWAPATNPKAVAVVAHGAGAGMEHAFMVGVSEGLLRNGVSSLRFNFLYTEEGRRSPDRQGLLREAWQVVATRVQGSFDMVFVARPEIQGAKTPDVIALIPRSSNNFLRSRFSD